MKSFILTMKQAVYIGFFAALTAVLSIMHQSTILTWIMNDGSIAASTNDEMRSFEEREIRGIAELNLIRSEHEAIGTARERLKLFVNASNTRLPQIPPPRTNTSERVLVVYSGPTDFVDPAIPVKEYARYHKKAELYRVNFEHFLIYGVQCKTQDTILVLTEVIADYYRSVVDRLHQRCQGYGHQVILAVRNHTCLDLESIRVALYGGYVEVRSYDYLIYLNCGVTGPSPLWANLPWTDLVLSRLSENIKMTGITLNCAGPKHVQSMLYALDRNGLQLVMDKGGIFDCLKKIPDFINLTEAAQHGKIVNFYERHLSQLIMGAGYGISSFLQPTVLFEHNQTHCSDGNHSLSDVWMKARLVEYFGKLPSLDEIVFFKTSRVLTPETAKLLNYTPTVTWNW